LKNDVIPSWESVRDPIKVNLDMGDGRTVHRTIGGNTVMYLVAPNGYVVDAFPGVYRPEDILPELSKSLSIANRPGTEWLTFHKFGGNLRILNPGLNAGKTVVEGPVLKSLDERAVLVWEPMQVIDESHIPRTKEEARLLVDADDRESDQDVANRAVAIDSRTNITALRPFVHRLLSEKMRTPSDLKIEMFKDLLKVPIDDPNFGLTNVLTPGG